MIITTHKRSLRRLCFYTCLSDILFTGGGSTLAGTPPRQVHAPLQAGTPLGAVHAGRYGQQAGGTHPTGCILVYYSFLAIANDLH